MQPPGSIPAQATSSSDTIVGDQFGAHDTQHADHAQPVSGLRFEDDRDVVSNDVATAGRTTSSFQCAAMLWCRS